MGTRLARDSEDGSAKGMRVRGVCTGDYAGCDKFVRAAAVRYMR